MMIKFGKLCDYHFNILMRYHQFHPKSFILQLTVVMIAAFFHLYFVSLGTLLRADQNVLIKFYEKVRAAIYFLDVQNKPS